MPSFHSRVPDGPLWEDLEAYVIGSEAVFSHLKPLPFFVPRATASSSRPTSSLPSLLSQTGKQLHKGPHTEQCED
jgi:hypothetical protein